MRIRGAVALVVVIGILVAGVYYGRQRLAKAQTPAPPVYATAPVTEGTLVADVLGFGSLNPDAQNSLQAPTSGTVDQVLVQQGDTVHAGEVVAVLSNPDAVNKVAKDKAQLQQDLQALATALGVSPAQALSAAQSSTIIVRAPQTGRVTKWNVAQGDNVKLGDPLATIVDDSKVVMQAALIPYDYQVTRVGDKVSVHFDQFAGEVAGSVTSISANPTPTSTGLTYPAVITLDNPGLLTPGLSGTVTIDASSGPVTMPAPVAISDYGQSTVVSSPVDGTVQTLAIAANGWVTQNQTLLSLGGAVAANALAAMQAQVAQDQTTLSEDQNTVNNLTVTSTIDGAVGFLNMQQGQKVSDGQFLGTIFNSKSMSLNMQVDELQVTNVHAGQDVQITVPALPGKVFPGKVTSVDNMGNSQQSGLATFNVTIEVQDTDVLKPGMTADAEIVVATVKNALMVPVEAVLQQGNQAVVEVLRNGTPAVVPVQVGLVNDESAQITSGLSAGETVITGAAGTSLPGVGSATDAGASAGGGPAVGIGARAGGTNATGIARPAPLGKG